VAGLLNRPLFDTVLPGGTEIFDGLAVRSSEEIIRGLECSFVAFCRSNVKRGQAIQQVDLPESQESGTRTCGKQSGTRASIVLQPKLRALAAGKSSFITSSEDLPRE
jgi:hypothetical protein